MTKLVGAPRSGLVANSKKDRIIGGTYNYYEHAAQIVQERGFKPHSVETVNMKPAIDRWDIVLRVGQVINSLPSKLSIFLLRIFPMVLQICLNKKMNIYSEMNTFQSGDKDPHFHRQLSTFIFIFCYHIRILTSTLLLKITTPASSANKKKGKYEDYDMDMLFADFARESELFDGFVFFIVYMLRVRDQHGGGYYDASNGLIIMIGISALPNADMNKGFISLSRSAIITICLGLKFFTLKNLYAQPSEFAMFLTSIGFLLALIHAFIVATNEIMKMDAVLDEARARYTVYRHFSMLKLNEFTKFFSVKASRIGKFVAYEYGKFKAILKHLKELRPQYKETNHIDQQLDVDNNNKENYQPLPVQHDERANLAIPVKNAKAIDISAQASNVFVEHSTESDKSAEREFLSDNSSVTPTKYHNPMQQVEFFQQFLDQYDETRITRFNSDIKEGNRKMAEVQLEMLDLNKQMKMVYQAVNSIKCANKNLVDKNLNLTKKLADSTSAYNELKNDFAQAMKEKSAIKQMAIKNEKEIKEIKLQSDIMEKSIESKNSKVNSLQQQVTQMLEAKSSPTPSTNQADADTQNLIQKFSGEITQCHEQFGILTQKFDSQASNAQNFKNDLMKALGTIEGQKQEIRALKGKLDQLSSKNPSQKKLPFTVLTNKDSVSSASSNQADTNQNKLARQNSEKIWQTDSKSVGLGWRSKEHEERTFQRSLSSTSSEFSELKKDSVDLSGFALSNLMKISPFTEIMALFENDF